MHRKIAGISNFCSTGENVYFLLTLLTKWGERKKMWKKEYEKKKRKRTNERT